MSITISAAAGSDAVQEKSGVTMKIWTRTANDYYVIETYLDEETGHHLGGRRWCPYRPHDGASAWILNPERKALGQFETQGRARMAVEKWWVERDAYSPACCTIAATDPAPTV